MSFARRRSLQEEEKCADPAKARARALEALAAQELSSAVLYDRLRRRFTDQAAAYAVAEMVRCGYLNDDRYAAARAYGLRSAGKSRRAAAQTLRQKGLTPPQIETALEEAYAPDDTGEDPDLAAACGLVQRRYRAKLEAGRKDLVTAALLRRGFAYPVVREALRRAEEAQTLPV